MLTPCISDTVVCSIEVSQKNIYFYLPTKYPTNLFCKLFDSNSTVRYEEEKTCYGAKNLVKKKLFKGVQVKQNLDEG